MEIEIENEIIVRLNGVITTITYSQFSIIW